MPPRACRGREKIGPKACPSSRRGARKVQGFVSQQPNPRYSALAATAQEYASKEGGGGSGIRTHVTVSRKHAFQACAFSHSATPPVSSRRTPFSVRTCVRHAFAPSVTRPSGARQVMAAGASLFKSRPAPLRLQRFRPRRRKQQQQTKTNDRMRQLSLMFLHTLAFYMFIFFFRRYL